MDRNMASCGRNSRFLAAFTVSLGCCLSFCSCWECPSYARADALARCLLSVSKTQEGTKRRLVEINRNLLSERETYGLPPGTEVDPSRIRVTTEKNKGFSGTAYQGYSGSAGAYTRVHLNRININVMDTHSSDHMSDNFLGLLSERDLSLWHDMDFNETLVHELAHQYIAQRYPHLTLSYDSETRNTAWLVHEGYASYLAFNWIHRHYGYSKRIARLRSSDSYETAYEYFIEHFTDHGRKVFWDAVDTVEEGLAPSGYRVHVLKAVYSE